MNAAGVLKALLILGSLAAWIAAVFAALRGRWRWTMASALIAVGTDFAGRLLSRRSPVPMPAFMAGVLLLPRPFQSVSRLTAVLQPRPGEQILEIGPGVGVHALPIAAAIAPDGVLHAVDVQQAMLDELQRRALARSITNVVSRRGDARSLPYAGATFDAAYLVSVLGEIPGPLQALTELRRVLKPGARLIVSELLLDPDFVSVRTLRRLAAQSGFALESRRGPAFAYTAVFRAA